MKKLNLIIVLFIARWASAQDVAPLSSLAAGVETIHSAKTAVLGLSYAYERALTPLTTLSTEIMLNGALEVREGSYFFALAPILVVEPRYYYNFLKRSSESKNTANNSANYLALGVSYVFGATVGDQVSVQQGVSVVPKWGLRRPLGQRFFFETAIGLGLQKRTKLDVEPALGLDIKFGYALGRRSTQ